MITVIFWHSWGTSLSLICYLVGISLGAWKILWYDQFCNIVNSLEWDEPYEKNDQYDNDTDCWTSVFYLEQVRAEQGIWGERTGQLLEHSTWELHIHSAVLLQVSSPGLSAVILLCVPSASVLLVCHSLLTVPGLSLPWTKLSSPKTRH